MNRILLIRRGGLGDTLLAAPLLRALRRAHPDTAIHVAGTREYCDVLAAYGTVDAAHSAEDFPLWLPERVRASLAAFSLVVGDEPGCVDRVIDPARVEAGVPFALQLCRQVGLETVWPDDAWLLPPRRSLGGPVTLAPGSGGARKCWPRERWLELADRLSRDGRAVDVVVGPVERERDDPRAWPWPVGCAPRFVQEAEVVRLARRLEQCQQLVGNDSGVTHLAAALGVPTLALFTATDPAVWAPVGPHVHVLGGPDAAPDVAPVLAVLCG